MNSQDDKNILQSLHCTLSSQQISVNQTISFVLVSKKMSLSKKMVGRKQKITFVVCNSVHLHYYSTVNIDVVHH